MESHTVIMDLKNQHIKDYGCSLLKPLLKLFFVFFYIGRGLFCDLYRKQSSWNRLFLKNRVFKKKIPIENHST